MQKDSKTINSSATLNSGNKIPLIGYGTWQLRGDDCVNGVQFAIKHGYIHIDTASIYQNQAQIKNALSKVDIAREKVYITSKVSPGEQGYQKAKQAVHGILKRLGLQYLDLILIHWPGVSKSKPESIQNAKVRLQTWKALIQLKKQGKVKDIGVSNFLVHHLEHLLKNSDIVPAINQLEIHPLLWQKQTIDFCRKNNIVLEAYSPLARQHQNLFNNKIMLQVAKNHGKSVAQIALRWCLQHNFVILPKSKSENRIIQNIQIFDFELSQKEMNEIQSLNSQSIRTCWDPNSIKF